MNIIVVGCGKVGETLCEHLVNENNDVTIIDTDASRVSHLCSQLDIIGIVGNGASITILNEANIEKADLFIAISVPISVVEVLRRLSVDNDVAVGVSVKTADNVQ